MAATADTTTSGGPLSRLSRDTAVVAFGLIALSALSAIQALMIIFIVGKSRATDAFFVAYSVYVPVALLGVSLRRTLVPLLGPPEDKAAFTTASSEIVGRLALVALLCAAVLAGLAFALAPLLLSGVSSSAQTTMTVSLLMFAVAAAAQIYAGSVAAVLNALQRFPLSMGIYVGASAVGVVISGVLMAVIGIIGATVGLLIAALALAVGHLWYLRRLGIGFAFHWRWAWQRRQIDLIGYIVAGVSLSFAQQMSLTFAVSAVTLAGASATVYSYAYYIVGVMLNVSSVPLSITILPRVVSDLATVGKDALQKHMIVVVPYVLVVLLPMLSAYAAFGKPLLHAVFASRLSSANIQHLYVTGLWLCPSAFALSIFWIAASMLLAARRWRAAGLTAVFAVAVAAATIYSASAGGLYAIAAAHSASAVLATCGLLVALFGRRAAAVSGRLLGATWRAPLLCLVFSLGLLTLVWHSVLLDVLLLGISLCAYCVTATVFWPDIAHGFRSLTKRGRAVPRTVAEPLAPAHGR